MIQVVDNSYQAAMKVLQNPVLDVVADWLTQLGGGVVLAAVLLASAVTLYRWNRLPSAIVLIVIAVMGMVLVEVAKDIVERPRPSFVPHFWKAGEPSYSYPSGHAFNSASVYLGCALILGRCCHPKAKRIMVLGALFLTGLVGLTRPYLNVHYLSDVLGGWAGGVGWALLIFWLDQRLSPSRPATQGDPSCQPSQP